MFYHLLGTHLPRLALQMLSELNAISETLLPDKPSQKLPSLGGSTALGLLLLLSHLSGKCEQCSTVTYDLASDRTKFTDQVYTELKDPLLYSRFTNVRVWLGGKGKKDVLGNQKQ